MSSFVSSSQDFVLFCYSPVYPHTHAQMSMHISTALGAYLRALQRKMDSFIVGPAYGIISLLEKNIADFMPGS